MLVISSINEILLIDLCTWWEWINMYAKPKSFHVLSSFQCALIYMTCHYTEIRVVRSFFWLKTSIEPTFWNSLYSLGPSFPRIYSDSGFFSGAAFTNRQLISIFVLILNWVICHKGTGKQEQWKMAAIGSGLTSSLGLTQAERAFRPWWDAIEDHIVYTIIILVCTSVSGSRSQDIKSNFWHDQMNYLMKEFYI